MRSKRCVKEQIASHTFGVWKIYRRPGKGPGKLLQKKSTNPEFCKYFKQTDRYELTIMKVLHIYVLQCNYGHRDIYCFSNQQLSQGAYNTKENRPHFVMANEIRAEVSLKLYTSVFNVPTCTTVHVHCNNNNNNK